MEIAVFLGRESPEAMPEALRQDETALLLSLAALLDELATPVHAFLIFADNLRPAPRSVLLEARRILGRFAPVGSGSNANFAEFNRQPMDAEALDRVSFAANPQVHAFDDQSVMETPEALPHVVQSARVLFPGKGVSISPLTLKPRFNAVALGPERVPLPGELPPNVDERQKEPFCAAWTLAVLAALAQSGFGSEHDGSKMNGPGDSLTLFETIGPRGVMDEGGPFPVFEVLRQIALFRGQKVYGTTSTDARRVAALAFQSALFVANLSDETQAVDIEGRQAELLPYEVRKIERKSC